MNVAGQQYGSYFPHPPHSQPRNFSYAAFPMGFKNATTSTSSNENNTVDPQASEFKSRCFERSFWQCKNWRQSEFDEMEGRAIQRPWPRMERMVRGGGKHQSHENMASHIEYRE